MPDHEPKSSRPLSEISHLFLSSIRDAASNGQPKPQRTPPASCFQKPNVSMDLTPEEFAQVFVAEAAADGTPAQHLEQERIAPVSAVIGAHLNGKQFDRVKQFARHIAAPRKRIGLIEADASEFRLMCFDGTIGATNGEVETAASESYDPRRMAEAINELNWDVDRWLLFLPNPRVPEARLLLREVSEWVLLSTCDHDGVVSCYRTLKGLTDTRLPADRLVPRPNLSLALLDAADRDSAEKVFRKLASVCQQFLDWPLTSQVMIRPAYEVAEHLVVCCRPTRDKGQIGTAPQWEIIGEFLARARASRAAAAPAPEAMNQAEHDEQMSDEAAEPVLLETPHTIPAELAQEQEEPMRITPPPQPRLATEMESNPHVPATTLMMTTSDDVIDLAGDEAVLSAILRHRSSEWVECPIVPPMCDKAKLAVGRDRRIVLIGEAGHGLTDLRAIGRAYQWLIENRNLIAMAVPQLSIDAHAMPQLSLLVDRADSSAATLQPMLQNDNITIETYRKLRWGGKTGLLLEAA
ncbi:MAG TPA: hypothetical protein VGR35_04770 [Tepidisphaeraceae bacterium]|nr:hypothetical protein [Tepidisphaeraceae bacterium]